MNKKYLAIVALLGACAPSNERLEIVSILSARTDGVAMAPDGLSGRAAMPDRLCEFRTTDAVLTDTAPLPVGSRVLDGGGWLTLISAGGQTRIVAPTGERTVEVDLSAGRLTESGFVGVGLVDGACALVEERDLVLRQRLVAPGLCDGGIGASVLVDGDGLAVAAGYDVQIHSLDTTEFVAVGADRVAVAANDAVFWLARTGEIDVWAVRRGGGEMWRRPMGGEVTDVVALGDGRVAVSVRQPVGGAFVRIIAGNNGRLLDEIELPEAVRLYSSADGRLLAAATETTVGFMTTGERLSADDLAPWNPAAEPAGLGSDSPPEPPPVDDPTPQSDDPPIDTGDSTDSGSDDEDADTGGWDTGSWGYDAWEYWDTGW